MSAADRTVVIIPTLNEAGIIRNALDHVAGFGFDDVVVADGGSVDGTIAHVPRRPGIHIVESEAGRGRQIGAGLDRTGAAVALVLHADTRLPKDAMAHIRRVLADPAVAGGCFRLRFDEQRHPVLAASAWATRFETAFTSFGDQAMFFRRDALDRAGGMPTTPLFEDVLLRKRLKSVGRFVKLKSVVTTSARRFKARGPIRSQLLNTGLMTAFQLGVSPERLVKIYRIGSK